MLEAGLRGGTVAVLLLVAILSLRDSGRTPAGRASALFFLSAVCYVICSAPDIASLDTPLGLALLAVSYGHPALFWMWASATFDDAFKPSWWRGVVWLGLVALGMWSFLDGQFIVGFAHHAMSLLFVGLAAWHALAGRETDLVEARRRLRVLLALSVASYAAVLIVTDVIWPGSSVSSPFSIVNAAGLAMKTFVIALLWLGMEHETSAVAPTASDQPSSPRPEAPAVEPLDRQEAALLEALRAQMEEQKLYRHDGLTIAALAARLAIPEYRLRRLINRRLGHRNFSSFINSFRLSEARAALADPVQANVPILTIALDTGFQSLAPFNRAFKLTAGMTPREYRRQHLFRPEPGFAT